MAHSGGCFCGELRFESRADPVETGYCHCSICRRTTGAPLLAFASFPIEGFSYIEGEPRIYASSPIGQREFCGTCGTQICFRESASAQTVDVNSGALDDIGAVVPDYHIYTSSRVEWLKLADELPEHENARET
jgi:hypothetical protein